MRVAVYTVITDDYDSVKPPAVVNPDYDYICFTDQPINCKGWDRRIVNVQVTPKWTQRKIKILGFDYLDYDVLIYLDGSFRIVEDIKEIVDKYYFGGFLLHDHPTRSNLYDEAIACMGQGKQSKESCFEQIAEYQKLEGVNFDQMYETGFMIRDRSTIELMQKWWNFFKDYPMRDQLSLIPALGTEKPSKIDREFTKKYIRQYRHKVK